MSSRIARAWNFNIDFIGRMSIILWSSLLISVVSLAALAIVGLNFGTDFAGGNEIQIRFPRAVSETQIRNILQPMDLADARVQRFGAEEENSYLILVRGDLDHLNASQLQELKEKIIAQVGSAENFEQFILAESQESLHLSFNKEIAVDPLRGLLEGYGLKIKQLYQNERQDKPEYTFEFQTLTDKISDILKKGLGLPEDAQLIERVDFVGPQVGSQIRNQGIWAVFLSLLLILFYVSLRFDTYFSPGAIVATVHDVVVVLGFFAVTGVEFNQNVVAAILTLIGFSLNDTIVVYDRIRENIARLRGQPLRLLVNNSINETLSRTILTSGTVLLVVTALLILGGPQLYGFSVAMFVGVIVGTYSSIAVASPIYILLKEGNIFNLLGKNTKTPSVYSNKKVKKAA